MSGPVKQPPQSTERACETKKKKLESGENTRREQDVPRVVDFQVNLSTCGPFLYAELMHET